MCPLNILNPAVNNLQQLILIECFVFDPGFYSFDSDKDCKIVNYYSSAVETRKKTIFHIWRCIKRLQGLLRLATG